jgi:hypothetical protein
MPALNLSQDDLNLLMEHSDAQADENQVPELQTTSNGTAPGLFNLQ